MAGKSRNRQEVSVLSFQYFIESKAYKNITIYIDEISSFQVFTSQRVVAEASLSKSTYQSIVEINLVFTLAFPQGKAKVLILPRTIDSFIH